MRDLVKFLAAASTASTASMAAAGFVAAGLVLCAAASPSRAAVWIVPSQVSTIAAALDSATAGDVVSVQCGTYFEHGLVLPSRVRLESANGDPSCVTIDGQGLGRILECSNTDESTFVRGITFTRGSATTGGFFDNGGGAIRAVDSFASVQDCVFVANNATRGGALGLLRSDVVVTACTFTSNTTTSANWAVGGAIYCEQGAPVIDQCTFTGNTAFSVAVPGDAGAVFAKFTDLKLSNSTFVDNHAGIGAGAFYSFSEDRSVVTACEFRENGSAAGGAMYLERSLAKFEDCIFAGNEANSGGAVYMEVNSVPVFDGCTFEGNRALVFAGGAVDTWFSSPTFEGCAFLENESSLDGGALTVNGSSVAIVTDGVFARNVAQGDGGALRVRQVSQVTITRSTFVANAVGGVGGALSVEDDAVVSVDASIVAFSASGGAAVCAGSGILTLACTDVFGNAGGDWTGCLAAQAGVAGNLEADPWFCDVGSDDLAVRTPESPCLPENNSCGVRLGASGVGCGCPTGATILVPTDVPSIAAAITLAQPGDVIGVCDGTWTETIELRESVHVRGLGPAFTRLEWPAASAAPALVRAASIGDPTIVAGLALDGLGLAPAVVLAESTSTGLHLQSSVVTGGLETGVRNGPDSRVRIGGELAFANDLFGNGVSIPRNVWNENTGADSLDALLNYWGTEDHGLVLDAIEGPVRTCPFTDATHTLLLCSPPSAIAEPEASPGSLDLAIGPNPFRESSTLALTLPEAVGFSRINVYDVSGRRVDTLWEGPLAAGPVRLVWPARGPAGRRIAPGVYFVRFEVGDLRAVRKLVRR